MEPISLFKRYSIILILGLFLSLPAPGATLLILGDSLSDSYNMPRESGWAHLLSERLGPGFTVVNASISGETTAGGTRRIEDLLESYAPQVLLVILGGNDGLRGLNPRQLESNLAEIIEAGQATGARVLLMQIRMPANLGPAYVERFEAVYPRLADRYRIQLVPFFLDGIFDRPGMLMPDGIHPTEAAQPKMLEALWPHLQPVTAGAKVTAER